MTEGGESNTTALKYDIDLIERLWNEGKTYQEILTITQYDKHVVTRYLNYLQVDIKDRLYRANLYKGRKVQQFYMNGQFIKEYPTVAAAERELQKTVNPLADSGSISYACNGKINSAYGYLWKYSDDTTLIEEKVQLPHHRKQAKINQYDLLGKYIQTFNSQEAARQAVGLKSISSITQACQGVFKTSGGFIWRYYDESLPNPLSDLDSSELPIRNQSTRSQAVTQKSILCLVDQYDLQGNYIHTYTNMVEAAQAVGLKCQNNIWKACNGQQKTAGGYIWKYNREHKEVQ